VFLDYYQNLRLVTALEAVFGVDAEPLLSLVDLLLKYPADTAAAEAASTASGGKPNLSELLRLNVTVAPVPLANQNPLTVLGGDNAGWPNGRRPIDDVTDVAIQVVGGANFAGAGDAVSTNDMPLPDSFPFLSTPWDGRNRVHLNP